MSDKRRHLEEFRCVGEPCLIRSPRKELLTDASLVLGNVQFVHFEAVDCDIKNCENGQWSDISFLKSNVPPTFSEWQCPNFVFRRLHTFPRRDKDPVTSD